jgi:hypothetical protein
VKMPFLVTTRRPLISEALMPRPELLPSNCAFTISAVDASLRIRLPLHVPPFNSIARNAAMSFARR